MFGKKKGAPIGNHNAQGRHNSTGLTNGRVLGVVGGMAGPVFSGTHGLIRGAKGAKSRSGSAALGGAIVGGVGGALAGAALGDDSGALATASAGVVGGINGGVHKMGHALGKAHYDNSVNTALKKRGR